MDYATLDTLKRSHPGWRLLAAEYAPMIIGFLHRAFIAPNIRTVSYESLVSLLDDHLFHLRERIGEGAFPRSAAQYLETWADDEHGWLRKYYPADEDEPRFDLTPASEKAIDFIASLARRQFVGTESRLMTVFDLLRQMAEGTETSPEARIQELEKRRLEIDVEIQRIRDGYIELMDPTQIKDRFQQMAATARGLLSDFREVEQNFRDLDRGVRERIATWEGAKGELLHDVFGTRDAINDSDQGKSFRAFWDLLMSPSRQEELSLLLETVFALPPVQELAPDKRLLRIHYDWLEAGEVAQRTVARVSEQLRRYLDDQAYLENRRIMRILRGIESHALALREDLPTGILMELDDSSVGIELPLERRLFVPPWKPRIDPSAIREGNDDVPAEALFQQVHVDKTRLAARIRKELQTRPQVSLADLVAEYPLEQGVAELVAYLSLAADDSRALIDDGRRQSLVFHDPDGRARKATLPLVIFTR